LMLRYVNEQRSGAANGLLTMLSSTGAITAPAAVSALLRSSGLAPAQSFRLDFLISCAAAALCLPLTALLPRPSNTKGEDDRA
jgi:MFS family permease